MDLQEINQVTRYYSYNEYRDLVLSFAEHRITSGEQTPEHIDATVINAQRMKRIDKQCVINDELKRVIQSLTKRYTWLLLTEAWCGDSAQNIPVMAKMAEINSNIHLKVIFRDENPQIMDAFLTNGSRAIPKLIFIGNEQVIGSWGPRPRAIQEMVLNFKQAFPEATHDEFVTNLHLWYARDKTQAIQQEFTELLKHYH